jgi:threonyl-tRNA synthetase
VLTFLLVRAIRAVTVADHPQLETLAKTVMKEKQPFERLTVSKEKLLEMFHVSPSRVSNRICATFSKFTARSESTINTKST